ncbi:serine/threonine-protein kinase [Verrucomicrobium spinosum]|uniref:serine/threonine-protein kinase n=1 Tax=Verrucomicrobium spinosum TaxID=2736 RepID=UPI00094638B6|nr:serine/threonine-protein kinase [Verrucomicrobium spinosum]
MNLDLQDADDPFRLGRFEPPPIEELNGLIPDFEFVSLIDRGGMGAVYQARQKALGRMVAVKLLPPALRNRRVFAERFLREARILAKLSHRHIVSIYDYGEIPGGGSMFYAMEYVKGTNLRHLMRKGEMTPRQMLTIVTQICDALQYSHHKGVIHRDVKPANILIDEQGNVKVADFGLAKKLGLDADGQGLTSASDALGTPDYIAPEAMTRDQHVDHRADIYSLGVMLYEMLTGSVPRGVGWDPPSRAAGADARLDGVVRKALQTNPNRRFQQVSDVTRALEGVLKTGPIKQADRGPFSRVDAGAVTRPYSHLLAPARCHPSTAASRHGVAA